MTIAEIEEIFLEQMPGFYEKDEIKAIASLSVQHVCNISRSYFLLHKSMDLSLAQETALIRILDELRFGKPLQHVLGEADFFGLRFKVNSSVLVPRPETEELVDWIIKTIESEKLEACCVLDIGTGSGCIPIAIKKNLPFSEVYSVDISESALEVARQNSLLNDAEVNYLKGDILCPSFNVEAVQNFKVIVSNPPYITQKEKRGMSNHVLEHEPHSALFVPDEDPLLFYRSIATFSEKNLSDDGHLFLEINEGYGAETLALLREFGFRAELRKDLQGKDRMIKAEKP